eukprot:gene9798-18360_t
MKSINEGLLTVAMKKLKEATPPPLCAGFDKENMKAAIEKQEQRKRMVTQEVPATSSGKMEKIPEYFHNTEKFDIRFLKDKQCDRAKACISCKIAFGKENPVYPEGDMVIVHKERYERPVKDQDGKFLRMTISSQMEARIVFKIHNNKYEGFCAKGYVYCEACENVVKEEHLSEKVSDSQSSNESYEVNARAVFAFMVIVCGFNAIKDWSTKMTLPNFPSKLAYQSVKEKIVTGSKEIFNEVSTISANVLHQKMEWCLIKMAFSTLQSHRMAHGKREVTFLIMVLQLSLKL